MSAPGKLVGVGVGPGDPELITLKAVRVLEQADVVAHFTKAGNSGNARSIAARYLKPGICELPLTFPVTTELPRDEAPYCDAVRAFYDAAARDVASYLDDGRLVAVVCEGDPLFYGSYMHLHVRLAHRGRCGREWNVWMLVGGRDSNGAGRRRVLGASRHACARRAGAAP